MAIPTPILKQQSGVRKPHFHEADPKVRVETWRGGKAVVACYHNCRGLLTNWRFWLATFTAFPVEHLIWEKLWPFKLLTKWWGL